MDLLLLKLLLDNLLTTIADLVARIYLLVIFVMRKSIGIYFALVQLFFFLQRKCDSCIVICNGPLQLLNYLI